MSTTTQEDYFGDVVDSAPRHRKHRRKHSKPRAYPSDDDDSEVESTIPERVHEEKEYRKPGRKHKYRETVDTVYKPEPSDTETDAASDDGKRRRRKHRHRRRERIPDDASSTVPDPDSATDTERSERDDASSVRSGRRERAKSFGESALTTLGLKETYNRARSKSRGRRNSFDSDEGYDSNSERHRSSSRSGMKSNSAQAAIIAAAVEAFRARKEPGGVTGGSALKRIVQAAVASGAVEKYLDRKGDGDEKKNRRVAGSVLAGLAAQRSLNGRRNKGDDRDHDHDEHSNHFRDLAASGLVAAAGKKFLDYQRSRSQSRGRDEDPKRPGFDRKRSRSVGEALAALGLGGAAASKLGRNRKDSKTRRSRIQDNSSDSSLSDSDIPLDEEEERERHKRLRRKEIISVALAILATLHLGQSGYEARDKRAHRKELLESGRITEEESASMKRKSMLKDATAVGLAIFAATEAVKSWKAMQKNRQQHHTIEEDVPRIEEHRRRKTIEHSRPHRRRTPSPARGEASKYYSQPGYMGPPPGAYSVPTYMNYPSSGPIPSDYGSRDAYSTRDGRDIPVRHKR